MDDNEVNPKTPEKGGRRCGYSKQRKEAIDSPTPRSEVYQVDVMGRVIDRVWIKLELLLILEPLTYGLPYPKNNSHLYENSTSL